MKVIDCKQGSNEWFQARSGKVTASEVAHVIAFLKRGDKKGGETEARANYKASIVTEILTGDPDMEGYESQCMKDGKEYEPFARAAYEIATGADVDKVGFVVHPTIERAGSSPDGLVGDDGMIEIKCPKPKNHIRNKLAGVLPEDHEPQVMWNLACTGRKWCDFVSFGMRLSERYQLLVVRAYRDEARIAELEAAVVKFLAEVDETVAQLNALSPEPSPTTAPKKKAELSEALEASLGITDADIERWYGATP